MRQLERIALHASHAFCAIIVGIFLGAHVEYKTLRAEAPEVICFANILYHESRGEAREHRYTNAMLTKARRDDPDPQWPKSFCGIAGQKRQISGLLEPQRTNQKEESAWWDSLRIAYDVYRDPWQKYRLPQGWGCARFWMVKEEIINRLPPEQLKKLGITTERAGMRFFEKLLPVGQFGSHVAYQDRRGCKSPMPTT